ncbi:MAG: hypothetical protein H8E29_10135 [Anaerolineales bacterium]|uniref:Transcriptional regulator MraZ n=1 Tax=Candidatus Desulfolinea nitratireducens TaxID=2841698 RepID=A0A8J6NL79_9CHLR|nr:hypothetical protein [Candidatus Desulfolinea nitratireducens]
MTKTMFYGQYTSQIDTNRSITLPGYFLNELAGNIYMIQGFDRNLIIMSENSFTKLYQRVIGLNMADPLVRLLARLLLGNTVLTQLKEADKMQLSERLSDYAELSEENQAVLVGQGDHVEIWSQPNWEKQNLDLQDSVTNANRFASLDLSF